MREYSVPAFALHTSIISLFPLNLRRLHDSSSSKCILPGHGNIPSVKLLMASFRAGLFDKYLNVTLGSPSLIMKCTIISDLNTIVQVESLKRFCSTRNTSATPCSPGMGRNEDMLDIFGLWCCELDRVSIEPVFLYLAHSRRP